MAELCCPSSKRRLLTPLSEQASFVPLLVPLISSDCETLLQLQLTCAPANKFGCSHEEPPPPPVPSKAQLTPATKQTRGIHYQQLKSMLTFVCCCRLLCVAPILELSPAGDRLFFGGPLLSTLSPPPRRRRRLCSRRHVRRHRPTESHDLHLVACSL